MHNEIHDQLPIAEGQQRLVDEITEEEVHSCIFQGRNSAPGGDGINRRTLRKIFPAISAPLKDIFNKCLTLGYYPVQWESAKVIMIPKPGKDPTSTSSYRPINLLSILGKTLEKMITTRLKNHIEDNHLLPSSQYGFRSGLSTMDVLVLAVTKLSTANNCSYASAATFLDLERSFDKMWAPGFMVKIGRLPIPPLHRRFLGSYLSDRTAKVFWRGSPPREFPIGAGVPQGGILSPLLFLIYMHDIPQQLYPTSTLIQFADDTAYRTSHRHMYRAVSLHQREIDCFADWGNKWKLPINPNKTQQNVRFIPSSMSSAQRFISDLPVHINEEEVPIVNSATYLGIIIDKYLNFNEETQRLLKKNHQRLTIIGSLRGCAPDTLVVTYKTFIRSLIDYSSPIISSLPPRHTAKIQSFERRTLRKINYLPPRFPSNSIYESLELS